MNSSRVLAASLCLLGVIVLAGCLDFKFASSGNQSELNVSVNASLIPTNVPFGGYNGTDNRTNQPTLEPPLPPGEQGECVNDLDCAPAGCSGELCVVKSQASSVISACIFKPEYACAKTDGIQCGCVQGSCAFKPADQYASCVANKRAQP